MLEEAKTREEIEEFTGISSRGFLLPPKNVREEVQGMLSKGSHIDKRKELVRHYPERRKLWSTYQYRDSSMDPAFFPFLRFLD